MAQKTGRTKGDRFGDLGSDSFVGRLKETKAFLKTLDVLELGDKAHLEKIKTNFNVFGEGGMGKTTLLEEFERKCRGRGSQFIVIDARPVGEEARINTIVDFMRVFRQRCKKLSLHKFLGSNPFAEFDKDYNRYSNLEQIHLKDETKQETTSAPTEKASQFVSKALC